MGTSIPKTAVGTAQKGTTAEKMLWLQEKRSWQHDRGMQGAKTLDIIRYAETGGIAYYLVEPTYSQVSGLSGLQCYYDKESKKYSKQFQSGIEAGNCVFILYDVTGGVSNEDVIQFEGYEYTVQEVSFEEGSGRYEILAKILRPIP